MTRPGFVLSAGLAAVFALNACSDPVKPPQVASVSITSSAGSKLAVGKTLQLSAEARDLAGIAIPGNTMEWSSSAPSFAQVNSATGLVQGIAAGGATISAATAGVTGSFLLTVIEADLAGIASARNDTYLGALVSGLATPVRGRVQTALGQCSSGLSGGSISEIEECIADVRTEITTATDPSDRALLASLALYIDHFENLLGL